MDDQIRKLLDTALLRGNKLLSDQTGYLHLKYHALEEEIQYPIPLIENFLYTLLLFRTKSIENITIAKSFLERLLHFQSENGSFPVYLHEYPECKDHYQAVYLIAPLYWILEGFHHVLGQELKSKLLNALKKLQVNLLKLLEEKTPPLFMRAYIAGGSFALGRFLKDPKMMDQADKLFKDFKAIENEFLSPNELSHLIIASQMVHPDVSESFIKGLFNYLLKTWDAKRLCYTGPAIQEFQSGFEPKSSFYDLFMGYLTGSFSKRSLNDRESILEVSLIQATNDQIQVSNEVQEDIIHVENTQCKVFIGSNYSYSFIDPSMLSEKYKQKGFSPFKFKWGNEDRLHTIALEGLNCQTVSCDHHGDSFEFIFDLGQTPQFDEKETCREISFYFDLFESTLFTVEGVRATLFELSDHLELEMNGTKFGLKFELLDGDGQFLGHFMRGNRPSQMANKGQQRFSAYDAQVFLRTIRRNSNETCRIKVVLEIHKMSHHRSKDS